MWHRRGFKQRDNATAGKQNETARAKSFQGLRFATLSAVLLRDVQSKPRSRRWRLITVAHRNKMRRDIILTAYFFRLIIYSAAIKVCQREI